MNLLKQKSTARNTTWQATHSAEKRLWRGATLLHALKGQTLPPFN